MTKNAEYKRNERKHKEELGLTRVEFTRVDSSWKTPEAADSMKGLKAILEKPFRAKQHRAWIERGIRGYKDE